LSRIAEGIDRRLLELFGDVGEILLDREFANVDLRHVLRARACGVDRATTTTEW